MKNNYPIRYCVLPIGKIYEKNKLDYHDERICYMAMKCYVVGGEIEYTREGEAIKKYKIVPAYTPESDGTMFFLNEPIYDYKGCINYFYAEKVFETKEEAEKVKDEMNEDLITQKEREIPKWANIGDKIKKTFEEYKKIEEYIEKNTAYLNREFKEQNLFSVSNYGLIKEDMSIYDLIEDCFYDKDIAVYTVTKEEYEKLKEIEADDEVNEGVRAKDLMEFMHTPLMLYCDEDDFAKLLPPKDSKDKSMYIRTGDAIYQIAKRKSYKDIVWDEIHFTMETFDDIVESYNIGFKRKDTLTLKMKRKDIWINDRYKY